VSAREDILGRVRAAIAPSAGAALQIPREYRTHTDDRVETLIERLHDYGAQTRHVAKGDLGATVRAALHDRGAVRMVAPDGIPDAWLEGVEPLRDTPPLDPHTLDGSDGVITTCAIAIAETGTLVLDGSAGMGRRILSLVPDYHLCVVRVEQIVSGVPAAISTLDAVRPLTLISGPSATVDIELVRVGGVHGPRQLEVIIAE